MTGEKTTTHHRAGSWNYQLSGWQMKSQPVLWLTEEQPVSCLVDKETCQSHDWCMEQQPVTRLMFGARTSHMAGELSNNQSHGW
ncbi:hypothetical protein RRG08_036841 [Elysia crispata]|uniref:Uncharacterized protein n=1 Tax=Elysia crispata TaxID=231223 RepID=A0AAE0Y8N1_9GAST|nr:hypothetical protein RRG08_036841 [Elysia crispata]